ncbi:YdcF family protein [Galbibacter pacificus]|uniref:YdcF family protein n=1 Tax=Galbibacter pacificus TaxID=2996052 RepID=A0ABT6FRI3_9FLAO|nr:YdcF family protein [Galbibacter pacificus]MDG3582999.1 YdcF family protein [Galbibacter pacificus]MDG3585882.1 YdcF family protein [Galbibacter pacificus]
MKLKNHAFLLFACLIACSLTSTVHAQKTHQRTGMLVLGSADVPTLKNRMNVALKLYNTPEKFDYIIVSGGCNAHHSGFCEATEMAEILKENHVPEAIIHKEEKSQSTIGNYCYSRSLKDESGKKVMQEGDVVFVVSNHWHAFSVAGCLQVNDKMNAKYYIEGSINPKETDKLDYTDIFKRCTEDANFCDAIISSE